MLTQLKRRIPNPVKTKARYAYHLLASPLEWLSRDPLTPPRRLVFVGASDFRKIGHELFQCFVDPGGAAGRFGAGCRLWNRPYGCATDRLLRLTVERGSQVAILRFSIRGLRCCPGWH